MTLLQSPLMGAMAPAVPRRTAWEALIDWFVDARSRRVMLLVGGIWLLNAFDLVFTILAHEQGMLHEANPVARHVLSMGTPSIILYKVGLVLIGSYPLLRFRHARITEMAAMIVLLVYAMLAVRWSSCYELYAFSLQHSVNFAQVELPPTGRLP